MTHKPSAETCELPEPVRDSSIVGIINDQGLYRAICADLICRTEYVLTQMGGEHATESNPFGETWTEKNDFVRSLEDRNIKR